MAKTARENWGDSITLVFVDQEDLLIFVWIGRRCALRIWKAGSRFQGCGDVGPAATAAHRDEVRASCEGVVDPCVA